MKLNFYKTIPLLVTILVLQTCESTQSQLRKIMQQDFGDNLAIEVDSTLHRRLSNLKDADILINNNTPMTHECAMLSFGYGLPSKMRLKITENATGKHILFRTEDDGYHREEKELTVALYSDRKTVITGGTISWQWFDKPIGEDILRGNKNQTKYTIELCDCLESIQK